MMKTITMLVAVQFVALLMTLARTDAHFSRFRLSDYFDSSTRRTSLPNRRMSSNVFSRRNQRLRNVLSPLLPSPSWRTKLDNRFLLDRTGNDESVSRSKVYLYVPPPTHNRYSSNYVNRRPRYRGNTRRGKLNTRRFFRGGVRSGYPNRRYSISQLTDYSSNKRRQSSRYARQPGRVIPSLESIALGKFLHRAISAWIRLRVKELPIILQPPFVTSVVQNLATTMEPLYFATARPETTQQTSEDLRPPEVDTTMPEHRFIGSTTPIPYTNRPTSSVQTIPDERPGHFGFQLSTELPEPITRSESSTMGSTSPTPLIMDPTTSKLPRTDATPQSNTAPQQDIEHTTNPFMDTTTHTTNPFMDTTTHTTNPFMDTTTHTTNPFMDTTTHTTNPFMDTTTHTTNPFMDTTTHTTNPFMDTTTHTTNPFMDTTTHTNNPFMDTTTHITNPFIDTTTPQDFEKLSEYIDELDVENDQDHDFGTTPQPTDMDTTVSGPSTSGPIETDASTQDPFITSIINLDPVETTSNAFAMDTTTVGLNDAVTSTPQPFVITTTTLEPDDVVAVTSKPFTGDITTLEPVDAINTTLELLTTTSSESVNTISSTSESFVIDTTSLKSDDIFNTTPAPFILDPSSTLGPIGADTPTPESFIMAATSFEPTEVGTTRSAVSNNEITTLESSEVDTTSQELSNVGTTFTEKSTMATSTLAPIVVDTTTAESMVERSTPSEAPVPDIVMVKQTTPTTYLTSDSTQPNKDLTTDTATSREPPVTLSNESTTGGNSPNITESPADTTNTLPTNMSADPSLSMVTTDSSTPSNGTAIDTSTQKISSTAPSFNTFTTIPTIEIQTTLDASITASSSSPLSPQSTSSTLSSLSSPLSSLSSSSSSSPPLLTPTSTASTIVRQLVTESVGFTAESSSLSDQTAATTQSSIVTP